jgi:hypothetical protein
MQGTRGRYYYGSLEAAARFAGRRAEPAAITRPASAGAPLESLERLADPQTPGKPITRDVVLWGRCGFVPSDTLAAASQSRD